MPQSDNLVCCHNTGEICTFQIIGDNVDLYQKPSHQSISRRAKDHHWFHIAAVKDRVISRGIPQCHSQADISTLPLQTFLPSIDDCEHLVQEFVVLVARVVVRNFPAFKFLESTVPSHIPHQYSDVMKMKSEIVSAYFFFCIIQYI